MNPPFVHGHDWESYWTRWHGLESVLEDGHNPVEQLLEWIRQDVHELQPADLFTALQEISARHRGWPGQRMTSKGMHML